MPPVAMSSNVAPVAPSRPPRGWSLRAHLALVVVAAALPLLAFSVVMVARSLGQEMSTLEGGLRGTSRALALAVDREFARSVAALQLLASSHHLDEHDLREFYGDASRARDSQPWWTVWLIHPDGTQVMNLLQPLGEPLSSVAEREYFRNVLTTGQPAISSFHFGRITARLTATVAVPVMRDGTVRYVLAAGVDASALDRLLHGEPLPREWVRSITDANGLVVATTRAAGRDVGLAAGRESVERFKAEPDGFAKDTTLDGERVHLAFSRAPLSGWTVTIAVQAATLDAPVMGSVATMAGGLALVAVGLVAALGAGRRIERAFTMNEQRLRLALEAADLGAWDFDPRTGELECSDRARQFFGLPPGAPIDVGALITAVHPADLDRVLDVARAAMAMAGGHDVEFRTIGLGDHVERWIAARGRTLFDEAGHAVRMIGTVQDMTAPRRAAEERQRLALQVEAERAALLDSERRARADAEAASHAKDEFLAVLSHELRTPLTSILGWVRMLRSGKVNPLKTDDALATVERNTLLQARLINDLLEVSRIIAGKMTLDQARVDLAAVATRAIETVQADVAAKSLRLDTAIDPATGSVLGDATRLVQIVVNLVSNAVKFTPSEGTIVVRLERAGTCARLTVSDTGAGIRAELLPSIFEPFRQAEGTSRRRHEGLGLGLSIVRHLVEQHGGAVRAESAGEGRGSTFTVELPVMDAPVESPASAGGGDAPRAARVRLDRVRILLVEDHMDSRNLIRAVLDGAGATVVDTDTVAEALDYLAGTTFHVLVSDLGMPGADGFDLVRILRARERAGGRRLPAVALTAYASADDRQKAFAAGYDFHASKPVDPEALCEVVARAVAGVTALV
jgi:signal transduction histidine kinase/ActR/RegA family two-component response regulator